MKHAITIALLAAAVAAAQGPRGPQGGPQAPSTPNRGASNVNMSALQTITGAVDAVDIGYGIEYPSISVNRTLIKVAPVWYLLQKNFEIRVGDVLTVTAAASRAPGDPYLYAVTLVNAAATAEITLRDSAGLPLWAAANNGRGNPDAPRNGAGCVDPATIATVSGIIDKLSAGAGIQHPSMVVKTTDGKLVAVTLGPERLLLEADLELKVGQSVTLRYARANCTGDLLTLAITGSTGQTIVLRNDDGRPNWN
jgi:hypothetical protein